jgi:hypothetical protein
MDRRMKIVWAKNELIQQDMFRAEHKFYMVQYFDSEFRKRSNLDFDSFVKDRFLRSYYEQTIKPKNFGDLYEVLQDIKAHKDMYNSAMLLESFINENSYEGFFNNTSLEIEHSQKLYNEINKGLWTNIN